MSYWEFTAQRGWLELNPHDTLPGWTGPEEVLSAWLDDIGYDQVGDSTGTQDVLVLYASRDPESPWYFILEFVTPGERTELIFLPTFPDYMAFLKDYGAALGTSRGAGELGLLREWSRKTFRATHGHAPHLTCQLCAPTEYHEYPETRYQPGLEAGYNEDKG